MFKETKRFETASCTVTPTQPLHPTLVATHLFKELLSDCD